MLIKSILLSIAIISLVACNQVLKNTYTYSNTEQNIPNSSVKLSVIHTGKTINRASFIYESGSFSEKKILTFSAILIKHPKGSLLFDTGIGDSV